MVLQRPGQNLARRSAPLVDKHRDLHLLGGARSVGILAQLLLVAVLGVDNQLPLVEKFVGHGNRLVEEPSGIAAQVENQPVDPLGAQKGERPAHLHRGGPGELAQLDITDAALDAERRFDALDGDGAAHDLHLHQLGNPLPLQPETHGRAARPAQAPDDVVLRNLAPGDQRIVDFDDAVARPDPDLVAGPLRNDVQHDNRVGRHVENHADAVELAFERLVHGRHFGRGNIDRMGVELADQKWDDMLGERIHRHRVDVLVLDERKGLQKFAVGTLLGQKRLRHARMASGIEPQRRTGDYPGRQQQREDNGPYGIVVHYLFLKV